MKNYDYLIVGAGLFGSTFANLAKKDGKKVLVIDRRNHIAGNIYTENIEGINVHRYGAHIFHTDYKDVWDYVNSFIEFNRYTNSPVARINNEIYNMPFNMNTFSKIWSDVITPEDALRHINEEKKEIVGEPKNLEEQAFILFDKLIQKNSNSSCCEINQIAYLNPTRQITKNAKCKYIDMAKLSTTGSFPDGWDEKPYNGGMKFKNNDTILARITPCLENGKTAFVNFLKENEIAFGSTEYIIMAPRPNIPAELLYCLARYPIFIDYAVKNMNGSSGRQRVSAETIGKYRIPTIPFDELRIFGITVKTIFENIKNNAFENMRLSTLRNLLLPKLMSGEIDVSEIDI